MNEPVKHHFVPRFYLKGFTKGYSEKDTLWVSDSETGRLYDSNVIRSAFENDFYRADVNPDVDPMWIEKFLGNSVEPKMADALREVLQSNSVPADPELLDSFIVLVATSMARGRAMRRLLSALIHESIKEKIDGILEPDKYQGEFDETIQAFDDMSVDRLRELNRDDAFKYDVDRKWYMKALLEHMILAYQMFSKRRWVIQSIPDDLPDLICSDNPVGIMAFKPVMGLPWMDPSVVITFPLNRRTVALGIAMPYKFTVDQRLVGTVNKITVSNVTQIYASEPRYFSELEAGGYDWIELKKSPSKKQENAK